MPSEGLEEVLSMSSLEACDTAKVQLGLGIKSSCFLFPTSALPAPQRMFFWL